MVGEEVGLKAYFRYVVSFLYASGYFRELLRDVMDRSGLLP